MIDRLFSFGEIRVVYVMVMKYNADPQNKASISHFIGLDAFITDFINTLSEAIDDDEVLLKNNRQTLPRENFPYVFKDNFGKRKFMVAIIKYHRILQNV